MNARELRSIIKKLVKHGKYYQKLQFRKNSALNQHVWYESQNEHWLGWLKWYDGPGAYNRKIHKGRDARFIYNHIMCPPMLLYLPEALGVSQKSIKKAFLQVNRIGQSSLPRQCWIIRKVIPFELVEKKLTKYRK